MLDAPFMNTTVPVAVPLPGLVTPTAAVSVTVCPTTAGLVDEASEVEVDAWLTTSETALDVDAVKLLSPAYVAVIEWVLPVATCEVWQVATPDVFTVWLPPPQVSVEPPSLNLTVPVGTPLPGLAAATVAV
jgi:hypothetical protein